MAVYVEWEAVNAKVAVLSLDALTDRELIELQHRREVVARSLPAVDHQIINRLAAEADPKALGGTNLADVLSTRLRISKGEATRRIKQAELLGPRQAMTGEPLPPELPNVAAAQERGEIGPEHLRIIGKFFDDLPSHTDYQTRGCRRGSISPRWPAGWGRRNSARPPTGWRCCSIRTAICPMTPNVPGGAT